MKERPLRTTVIGSYPFPGWLEFASQNLEKFGAADLAGLEPAPVGLQQVDFEQPPAVRAKLAPPAQPGRNRPRPRPATGPRCREIDAPYYY